MKMHSSPERNEDHHFEWDDRLQDWLDEDLDSAQVAAVEEHIEGCEICRQFVAELRELDTALQRTAPRLSLDAAFDRQVFAHLERLDETQRAAARQRASEEFAAGLQALARGWRRSLALVASGAVAGVALALAIVSQFDGAGIAQALVAEGASGQARNLYQLATIMLLGAGIGAAVARWLASAAE